MPEILFVILHFLVCTLVICGVLLCLQRRGNMRSRVYFAIFTFITALELSYRLYVAYQTGVIFTVHEVLPFYVLITGILEILLMYLYPLEVIRPGWLTLKRLFMLFLPWLIIGLAYILIATDIRNLSSFSEIIQYIGEFNVWFRLLILFLYFMPYTILLLCIPYKWQYNSVDNKWIYKYVIATQGIGFMFSIVVLTGSVVVSCIHLSFGILFVLYVTYQELFLRLLPATVKSTESDDLSESNETSSGNPFWEKLTIQMNEKELWRTPDLTLEDLARNLNTNRTTLSNAIQQHGYSGYSEFINSRRIEAFTKALMNSKSVNTQQLFYEAGFRSKSTALRNFRLYMGCTPGEYIQRNADQKSGDDHSIGHSE